jgi:hypothetical protein
VSAWSFLWLAIGIVIGVVGAAGGIWWIIGTPMEPERYD